jgi:trans-aconitate methyltransferase
MIPAWIWIFIFLTGGLFALKISYVLTTTLVLPITQGALFVSSSRVRVAALLDAVPMQAGQLLIDIGCGDGRVLRLASKRYGARAIGYEVNLLAYIKARLLCLGDNNIQIKCKNFWKENLTGADVVFCYLYPDVMQRLSDKLRSDLKPGTVVASCNFALPGFQSQKVLRPGGALHNDPVYIYQV